MTLTTAPEDLNGTEPEDAAEQLVRRNCGQSSERNYECSELEVPIDYNKPAKHTVHIALRRIVADPLEPYRGILLVNPGGPGGEGIDFALGLFERGFWDVVAPGFDIVGFDPRGVAQSGERGCVIAAPERY